MVVGAFLVTAFMSDGNGCFFVHVTAFILDGKGCFLINSVHE